MTHLVEFGTFREVPGCFHRRRRWRSGYWLGKGRAFGSVPARAKTCVRARYGL
jgi:hypothetical protein